MATPAARDAFMTIRPDPGYLRALYSLNPKVG
jgi:hypothetical protein